MTKSILNLNKEKNNNNIDIENILLVIILLDNSIKWNNTIILYISIIVKTTHSLKNLRKEIMIHL